MKFFNKIWSFLYKNIPTIISATAIVSIIAVIFFATFPFQVAEFNKIKLQGDVQVGGRVEYINEYCQNVGKGVPRDITRFLVPKDKDLISPIQLSGNPTDETLKDAGCHVSDPIKLPIDSSIPPGEYKLLVKVKYCLFNIRCIPVQGESDYFTISKPDISVLVQSVNQQIIDLNERINADTIVRVSPASPNLKMPQQPNTQSNTPQEPTTTPTVDSSNANKTNLDVKVSLPLINLESILNRLVL